MRRVAPLSALRAFEAAARHLSFTKAAKELHVTPGAISQQVKMLEDHIGSPLFRRFASSLVITELGQIALPFVRDGFDRLAYATEVLHNKQRRKLVTVNVTQVFAAKWLVPRLDRFYAVNPDIDILIDASGNVDIDFDHIDIAVRYGQGSFSGMNCLRLLAGDIFPVCAAQLLTGDKPLRTPADLSKHTLLHIDWRGHESVWPGWKNWLDAVGATSVDAVRGPRFTHETIALQVAMEGKGIALAEATMVEDDIRLGRLVRPFATSIPLGLDHFVIWPKQNDERPEVALFRTWLMQQAAGDGQP